MYADMRRVTRQVRTNNYCGYDNYYEWTLLRDSVTPTFVARALPFYTHTKSEQFRLAVVERAEGRR